MFTGLGIKLLLAKLKAVPWQVWAVVALVVLIGVGACVHGKQVKSHDKKVIEARDKFWNDKLDKAHLEAMSWKAQVEKKQDEINKLLGARHDEETTHINRDASDVLVRGPGKASCRQGNNSQVSRPANGSTTSGSINDSGPEVFAENRASVPWDWLTKRAQQLDQCESDKAVWFDWYDKQKANFDAPR